MWHTFRIRTGKKVLGGERKDNMKKMIMMVGAAALAFALVGCCSSRCQKKTSCCAKCTPGQACVCGCGQATCTCDTACTCKK